MRRLVVLGAGLLLVHVASGCQHVAGFCDCAPPIQPCCIYGLYPEVYAGPAVVPAAAVAPAVPALPAPPAAVVPNVPAAPANVLPPPAVGPEPVKEKIGQPREL